MKKRLAIITTHPIQYNAPFFKELSKSEVIEPKVFYTWGEGVLKDKFDPGFNKVIDWDIPLLEGYKYEFVENISKKPGSHHFTGIDNPKLVSIIKDWNADAILVYGWSFKSHLNAMRAFHGKIPVFFRGDSTLLDDTGGVRSMLKSVFLKYVYKHVDKAFYVGEMNKRYFLKYGLRDEQLVFAPHFIENSRFSDDNKELNGEVALWRAKLGIEDNEVVLLFAGKLEHKKNPLLLINLIEKLKDENIRLIIVGNGPVEEELIKAAAELPVIFIPFQNQAIMPVVYRLCDVFILPSKGPGETWGLALNEAMACGKAVIASDKCGGAANLINKDNGFIFSISDNNYLSVLETFIKSKSKSDWVVMGKSSQSKVQNFNGNVFLKLLESVLLKT